MASLNKVILMGNLGRDPEVRYTQSGRAVANFSIATTDSWKDRDGNRQERTEWHRIVAWARTAEFVQNYLKKGSSILVEGRLQTRIRFEGDPIVRETTESFSLKPGRWVVDSEILLPEAASYGVYAYELSFESRSVRFDERLTFVVDP